MTTQIKEVIETTTGQPITFINLSKRTGIPYATLKNAAKRSKISVTSDMKVFMDAITAEYIKSYKPRKRRKTPAKVVSSVTPRSTVSKVKVEDDVVKEFDQLTSQLAKTRAAYVERVRAMNKVAEALDTITEARKSL